MNSPVKLARVRRASLLKVPGIGDMVQQDAARILELKRQIKTTQEQMAHAAGRSSTACLLASISSRRAGG